MKGSHYLITVPEIIMLNYINITNTNDEKISLFNKIMYLPVLCV